MAFKSNAELEGRAVGSRVRLTRAIKVPGGIFEAGTKMRITGEGPRGLSLIDDEGNELHETALLGDFFERDSDSADDLRLKNG